MRETVRELRAQLVGVRHELRCSEEAKRVAGETIADLRKHVDRLKSTVSQLQEERAHALARVVMLEKIKTDMTACAQDSARHTKRLLRVINVLLQPETANGKVLSTDAQPHLEAR